MTMHQIVLLGRATKDAEELTSKKDTKFTKLSLAVNEYNSTTKEETSFFYDVLIFGKPSEKALELVKKENKLDLILSKVNKIDNLENKVNKIDLKTDTLEEKVGKIDLKTDNLEEKFNIVWGRIDEKLKLLDKLWVKQLEMDEKINFLVDLCETNNFNTKAHSKILDRHEKQISMIELKVKVLEIKKKN